MTRRTDETARNDQVERVEIGRDVEREAVNRDARSDVHPERTDLFVHLSTGRARRAGTSVATPSPARTRAIARAIAVT